MLSYSHAYHAGNHADILKHLTLVSILQCLQKKPKPYFFLDTHAGEGSYSLTSEQAKKNNEAQSGVLQLRPELVQQSSVQSNAALLFYVELCLQNMEEKRYLGSPLIANALLRRSAKDKGHACELHPEAYRQLDKNCSRTAIKTQQRDGFKAMVAMLPPTPKRGLILIDPPYENTSEYDAVLVHLQKAIKRWSIGIYAIWYPLLSPTRINRKTGEEETNPKANQADLLRKACSELNVKSVLDIQFSPSKASKELGMYGSGMVIINPPWQLNETVEHALKLILSSHANSNNAKLPSQNTDAKQGQTISVTWLKSDQ